MDNLAEGLDYIKEVANRLTIRQESAMKSLMDKTDKKIESKINAACKRLTEQTIADIKERLEIVGNVEKISADIRELRRLTDALIEKQSVLTEVAYLGRQRLDPVRLAHLHSELIRSMDFPNDWFHKRNDLSLNKWFDLYQNGVSPNDGEE